jgi:hypothetical protein
VCVKHWPVTHDRFALAHSASAFILSDIILTATVTAQQATEKLWFPETRPGGAFEMKMRSHR